MIDRVKGRVGTVVHPESAAWSTLGGRAAGSAGGAGLGLLGSAVGVSAGRMDDTACITRGGPQCGLGLGVEGPCVGVVVGQAWFRQLLKRSRRSAIALSWSSQEV